MTKPYYVTTPIYYVNGMPHIGAALTTIACDAIARYQRMLGSDAFLLTGTDENAAKVLAAAEQQGEDPAEFVCGLAAEFRSCWNALHVEYSDFIRTTEARHTLAVQECVRRLIATGDIYRGEYEGWYSISDETFFRDSEVDNGFANETGKPVVRVSEPGYYFRLSAFADRLLQHINSNPQFLQPESRRNEVTSYISEGLRDMYITRPNRGWGITVPGDESCVVYVWLDALVNYLAAAGWPDEMEARNLWPADLHMVGKEIFVRFHATLWPAMLMALNLPLPKQIFAHGWFTVHGAKGGKTGPSLPHPVRLAEFIRDRSGCTIAAAVDAERYLLCRTMSFAGDSEFSVSACLQRFNIDLANDLGNLVNRTVNMTCRYCGGLVPQPSDAPQPLAEFVATVAHDVAAAMESVRLNVSLDAAWQLVSRMNKYLDEHAPWALAPRAAAGDAVAAEQLGDVLYAGLEASRVASVLLYPFMPEVSRAIRQQIGGECGASPPTWAEAAWGGLKPGSRLGSAEPIFPRIRETNVSHTELEDLASRRSPVRQSGQAGTTVTNESAPAPVGQEPITIEEFGRIDLRVAEVLAAEPVTGATRLLRLTVHLGGDDTRTILAGIAEAYRPEELEGKRVVVVANLQPRVMRGIESKGMLLAADSDGKAILIEPDQSAPLGARVR
ncbi:MAG: methionine--tRNA ligase [Armatimonadetes bacterium]|nr:methionine--tRNA ligase [Armatimonadota bacterium]MDE2206264.1 methionine--tRNA ligase [Armatimonadota bacterium]